jgi:hypothetical protein
VRIFGQRPNLVKNVGPVLACEAQGQQAIGDVFCNQAIVGIWTEIVQGVFGSGKLAIVPQASGSLRHNASSQNETTLAPTIGRKAVR